MKNLGRFPASKEFSFLSYFNGSELGWVGVRQVHFLGGAPRGEGPVHGAQDSTWRTVGASWMRNRGTGEHRPSGRGRPDTGVGTLGPASRGCVKDHAVPAPCGYRGCGGSCQPGAGARCLQGWVTGQFYGLAPPERPGPKAGSQLTVCTARP